MGTKRIRMFPTIEETAFHILRENGPMNYRDITKKILEQRPIGGRTPERTVYAALLRSERVNLIGNGIFDLLAK